MNSMLILIVVTVSIGVTLFSIDIIKSRRLNKKLRSLGINWGRELYYFLNKNKAAVRFDKTISRQFPNDYSIRYKTYTEKENPTDLLEKLIDFNDDLFWYQLNTSWVDHCKNLSKLA